jgi:hypothetical protein
MDIRFWYSRCGVNHNEMYQMLSSGVLVTHD